MSGVAWKPAWSKVRITSRRLDLAFTCACGAEWTLQDYGTEYACACGRHYRAVALLETREPLRDKPTRSKRGTQAHRPASSV